MARKQGDSESGKLGNKIYYTWHGRQCERSMPTSVANPQTEAQQAHRSNFAMISKLSSYMKEAHLVGLHWHAIREHNSTYAIFRNLNKDCFTPDGEINLPRIIVSRGSVEQVEITSATIDHGVASTGSPRPPSTTVSLPSRSTVIVFRFCGYTSIFSKCKSTTIFEIGKIFL